MGQPAFRFVCDDPDHVPLFDLYTKGDFRIMLPWTLASRIERRLAPFWFRDRYDWDRLADFMFEPCYAFTGAWNSGNGYSNVSWEGKTKKVHRLVAEFYYGVRLPRHVLVDHLCRNRWCCQPLHLEPVTTKENTKRGNAILFGMR